MKNKISILILIFLLSLTLFACNKEEETNYSVTIQAEKDTLNVGEELELDYNTDLLDEFVWSVDDDSIATIDEFGFITALSKGEVEVMLRSVNYPDVYTSKKFTISGCAVTKISVSGINYGQVNDQLTFTITLYPKGINASYTVTSEDNSIATVNKDNTVTLNKFGVTNINIVASDEGGEIKYTQKVVCCNMKDIFVDSGLASKNYQDGELITCNSKNYYYGYNAYDNLGDVNSKVVDDCVITINNGTYKDKLTIKKNNVTIKGNGNPTLTGMISLVDGVNNVTIDGFKFNTTGGISLVGNNDSVLIQNNSFDNVTNNTCINFKSTEKAYNNISITNNSFANLDCYAILVNNMNNLKVTLNTFKNINNTCIYFDDSAQTSTSQWLFKGNIFENSNKAIETNILSSEIKSYDTIISIFDNTFDSLTDYCIYLDGNNNGTVSLDIRYNDFNNNKNLIYIDTLESRNTNPRLYANISYNNMIGDNVNYYVKTSDETINTINMSNNFYCTGTNKIDLSSINNKFSSNVNHSSSQASEKLVLLTGNKIYGKSALFTDQETSFICTNADTFTVSDNTILTIDNNGHVTPLKAGNAIISAYKGSNLIGTYDVKVVGELQLDYAVELLKVAYAQEGYVEGDNNYTKYGVWYAEQVNNTVYIHGQWCAMFVSWCADQAGIPTTMIPLYAACVNGRSWFEERGLFQYKESYTPKAGDIIFFLSNGASHTGIVISCNGSTVYTIEGNTSNMCAKRSYDVTNARITGYGTPNYPKYDGKQSVTFDVSNATDGSNSSTK